eukprot:TRINITY_DN36936_c0_g1_i2.p1 TRINITY_DN36936_c0_g1~~TRINITY_DN36936_c0_g1_i2.p1  ORF type:complete len:599 (-),score=126.98 TRINITY_DN36936_c0_g1_i2:36-1778(-)
MAEPIARAAPSGLLEQLREDINGALQRHELCLDAYLQNLALTAEPAVGGDAASDRAHSCDPAPTSIPSCNPDASAKSPRREGSSRFNLRDCATAQASELSVQRKVRTETSGGDSVPGHGWLGHLTLEDNRKKSSAELVTSEGKLGQGQKAIRGISKTVQDVVLGSEEVAAKRQSKLKSFTTRWEYETVRAICIILDAVLIAWETEAASQWALEHPAESAYGIQDSIPAIVLLDILTVYFLVDILVRIKADNFDLSVKAGGGWRWFNIVVVCTCLLQTVAHHAFRNERSASQFRSLIGHFSMLRIFRLLQVTSVSAVIRTHPFFRELRIMAFSLTTAMMSFLWSAVMFAIVYIVFGVFFVEGVLTYCVRGDRMTDASTETLRFYFGTLSKSVLTLNEAITGGLDWGTAYAAVATLGEFYSFVFLLFVAFSIVALMNVVNAVFVSSTLQKAQNDRELLAQSEMTSKKDFLRNMRKIFREIDKDHSGEIGFEELRSQMEVPAIGAYFSSIGVDVDQFEKLFRLLDTDKSGSINQEEFMFGCLRLKGAAKSLDIALMQQDIRNIRQHVLELSDRFGQVSTNASR